MPTSTSSPLPNNADLKVSLGSTGLSLPQVGEQVPGNECEVAQGTADGHEDQHDGTLDNRVHDFGAKDIGFFASCALLVNNITGPGVPQLSNMFVEAGWLFPVICIVSIWAMTTLSSAMFCEAMRKIPGNEHFRDRVEYTTVVDHYFGRKWYIASQVGLNGALQSLNIISVIQSAQVMDNLISVIFGKTCGLNLSPFQSMWTDGQGLTHLVAGSTDIFSCVNTNDLATGNAWGCHVVLTLGFVVTASLAIPCGRWNLDDNMIIQTVAFVLTMGCWIIWIAASLSAASGDESALIPAVNSNPNTGSQAAVLGTILFNFGFVTTVPSWVNEKRHEVSTNRVLWISTTICIFVFFFVGLPGAFAYSNVLQGLVTNTCQKQVGQASYNCPNDLLQVMTDPTLVPKAWDSTFGRIVLKTSVYMFPIVAVVSSIPVFSIVIKYNMIENNFSKKTSYLWGVIFPWIAAFPLIYMPNVLGQFVNFTSLIFVSFTDFIVPWALFIVLYSREDSHEESILGDGAIAANVVHHYAIPQSLGVSPRAKRFCSLGLMIVLASAAAVASVLTVVQGTYSINLQVCALVGN